MKYSQPLARESCKQTHLRRHSSTLSGKQQELAPLPNLLLSQTLTRIQDLPFEYQLLLANKHTGSLLHELLKGSYSAICRNLHRDLAGAMLDAYSDHTHFAQQPSGHLRPLGAMCVGLGSAGC